jgi:hypothetical protein
MTTRRSKRSESQPIGQARRNPPRVPLTIKDGNSAGIEAQPLRKDRGQSEECTCDHPAQRGRHQSEGRLLIQPFRADPDALGLLGRSHGLSQSDRHQGEREYNRDDAERSEPCRIGRRKKELPDNPGRQPRHDVNAQDLPPGFLRRCAVELALDDNEQPGKAEPGQGTGYNPCGSTTTRCRSGAVDAIAPRARRPEYDRRPGPLFHSAVIQSRYPPRNAPRLHQFEPARTSRARHECSGASLATHCPSV